MKKAVHFAILVLGLLVAFEPSLAVASCGQGIDSCAGRCPACCGKAGGTMGAMEPADGAGSRVGAYSLIDGSAGQDSAIMCELCASCRQASQNPSESVAAVTAAFDLAAPVSTGCEMTAATVPELIGPVNELQVGSPPDIYLLFGVIRI
jgi:hypothetical protein